MPLRFIEQGDKMLNADLSLDKALTLKQELGESVIA